MDSTIAAIQMTSTNEVYANLNKARELIVQAATAGAKLIVLPEMFATMGMDQVEFTHTYETFGAGPIQEFLAQQARQHNIWLVGGTIPIRSEDKTRAYAACLVFNAQGDCVGRYDKIHLFDVNITAEEQYQESARIEPGKNPAVIATPFGKLGLAVCYDLRFPELFRLLFNQGAEIIAVPSAFTTMTGVAHWEILLRARAIENTCYVIGAAQWGTHSGKRKTYGHSMIIDPWGKIISESPESAGVIIADIDLQYLAEIRNKLPIAEHQKIFSHANLNQR